MQATDKWTQKSGLCKPTPVFVPGEPHGQSSPVGYYGEYSRSILYRVAQGTAKSDTAERLGTHTRHTNLGYALSHPKGTLLDVLPFKVT